MISEGNMEKAYKLVYCGSKNFMRTCIILEIFFHIC